MYSTVLYMLKKCQYNRTHAVQTVVVQELAGVGKTVLCFQLLFLVSSFWLNDYQTLKPQGPPFRSFLVLLNAPGKLIVQTRIMGEDLGK